MSVVMSKAEVKLGAEVMVRSGDNKGETQSSDLQACLW